MTRSRISISFDSSGTEIFTSLDRPSAIPSVLQHLRSPIDPCHSNREIYVGLFYTFWSFPPIHWPFAFYPLVGYSTLHLGDYWYCSADEKDVEITISVPFPPLKSQRPSVPLLKSLEYFQQWS